MKKQSFIATGIGSILGLVEQLQGHDWKKPLKVTVEPFKRKRSLPQNALYWQWMTECVAWLDAKNYDWSLKLDEEIMREAQGDEDKAKKLWLHKSHKATFLGWRDVEYTDLTTGEVTMKSELIGTSGPDFDTGRMHFFMNLVYEYWMNLGLLLPIPEESEYQDVMRRQVGE